MVTVRERLAFVNGGALARRPTSAAAYASLLSVLLLVFVGGGEHAVEAALSKEDLLVVFPTFHKHVGTVEASRSWRRGVRTHIVADDRVKLDELRAAGLEHNETFSAMPDLPGMPLSLRHVMAPVLAHRAVSGKYKWMLLGDDDTLFSLPAVLNMLGKMKLSYTDPIAISDFLVHCHFENNKRHPRSPYSRDTRCPAPNATAAAADAGKGAVQPCMLPPERTQPPRFAKAPDCPPEGEISYYGGGGVILSQGLLRRLANHHLRAHSVMVRSLANARASDNDDWDSDRRHPAHASVVAKDDASFYAVVMSTFSEFGDTSMSEAWRRAGVGFTPPPLLPYQLRIPRPAELGFGAQQQQQQQQQSSTTTTAAAAQSFSSRKLLQESAGAGAGAGAAPPPSPPPRLSCAKIKSTGLPPVECRRFGSLGYHMDKASPAEVLARHVAAARDSPEAFRLIVSAHLRPHQSMVDEEYLATMVRLGNMLAHDGGEEVDQGVDEEGADGEGMDGDGIEAGADEDSPAR